MSKTVAIPFMLVSLGIFSVTCTVGCGSSSSGGGTGGAGGHAGSGAGGKATSVGGAGGGATGGRGGSGAGGTSTGSGGSGTDAGVDVRPDVATDVPRDVAQDVPRDVAQDVPQDVPQDVAQDVAQDIAQDVPRDVATDTGTDVALSGLALAAVRCPFFPSDTPNSMEPGDFCSIYLALCLGNGRDATRPDMATCVANYMASRATVITTNGSVGACESYHICNAYNAGNPTPASEATHCPHAEGLAICL